MSTYISRQGRRKPSSATGAVSPYRPDPSMRLIPSLISPAPVAALRASFSPKFLLAAAIPFFALAGPMYGQLSTADILGTVTDATGAVIPNATVTLTNNGTQVKRASTTSAGGDYTFSLLPVGTYTVTVNLTGFKTATTANLAVEAGDRARADVRLSAGAVGETVTVEASTPLLQADNATVSSTVTAKAVQDLPLNGRNFVQLVQLVPGANDGPGNGLTSGGRPDDRRQSASFSVNGQDDTLNNYTIDGIDDNERVIGTIGVRPNVEGIQEITVQTNSYAPEAGRTAGGVVSLITRSGTNGFHGSAYEFFRNDILNTRNVLQTTGRKPELRQNQFGGSIGGPILHDRTFFFGDYEGFRLITGTTYQSTVPTIDEYNNIHSLNGGSPQALIAAGNGTAQYAAMGHAIDPVALNYLMLFPAPTNANLSNNYVISPSRSQTSNTFDVRVDHRLNENNQLFARYDYNKVNSVIPPALGVSNGLAISGGRYIFAGPATDSAQQYALGYTHLFSPRLIMDLRAAYTRINNLSLPLNVGLNPDTTVGFGPNMNFDNKQAVSLTPVGIGSFSDIGDGDYVPLQDIDNTFQYLATFSYTRGNHSLRAGASFIRRQARNVQSAQPVGEYGFGLSTDTCTPGSGQYYDQANNNCGTNPLTGQSNTATLQQRYVNQLASTLLGGFTSDDRRYDLSAPDYRTYEPSGFLQDSWKATPKLTLLYGARYDVFTPFTEAHNRISNFNYSQAVTDTAATIGNALQVANVGGVDGHAGIKVDYSNVAPRVGFAYSVAPTTVFRGGYGMSFFPGNYTSNADLKNAPFVSVFNPNCQSATAIDIQTSVGQTLSNIGGPSHDCRNVAGAPTIFSQGLPIPAAQTLTSNSLSFTAEDPKFRSALIQQFNLQLEQQFGANVFNIGYVGNIGQHLAQTVNDINVPKPFNSAAANVATISARPLNGLLPNLSTVNWLQSEGVSNYNALQTSFQRRFTQGLAFDINYTWGKAMSDNTGFSEEGNQGWSNADPTRIRQIDYGIAENDIQNRFALSLNYQFQYGKSWHGLEKQFLAGWEVNTISEWQTGKPFSIVNGGGGLNGTGNRATPFNNGGNDRPNEVADWHVQNRGIGANGSSALWFNPNAFCGANTNTGACNGATFQQLGTVGNEVRNTLFGPDFRHIDLSVFKDFAVTERATLQFRAEGFNVTNTTNWYIQNNNNSSTQLGASTFGQVTNTDPNYQPRIFQFALKAQF